MPRYETKGDRTNEDGVAKIFCLNMNCTYKKVKEIDDYSPDVSFWRSGERVAIGEIKCRTCSRSDYTTYMISKAKVDGLIERWHPLPVFLIVRWEGDGVWWRQLDEGSTANWWVAEGGRRDRNDKKDIEQCYHIPIGEFVRVKMDGVG